MLKNNSVLSWEDQVQLTDNGSFSKILRGSTSLLLLDFFRLDQIAQATVMYLRRKVEMVSMELSHKLEDHIVKSQ